MTIQTRCKIFTFFGAILALVIIFNVLLYGLITAVSSIYNNYIELDEQPIVSIPYNKKELECCFQTGELE
jgi:hypothetical protein